MISVLPALIKRDAEESTLRLYATDALKLIAENTAKFSGGNYMKLRWADIINPPKKESRTADEIIEHMKKRLEGVR